VTVGLGLRSGYRPTVHGLHHLPHTGGAILTANHLSVADELFLILQVVGVSPIRLRGRGES
jgi:1-acyl-sn-glycerol-3-phosphate acyltransferase